MKHTLYNTQQAKQVVDGLWRDTIKSHSFESGRLVIEVKPATRSLEQNARLWAMLTDVSRQVIWHGRKLTPEDWKHVFTASLRKLDVVPNIEGSGFVALGMHTSTMTVREMGDLMTLIEAFGAERDVHFTTAEVEHA